MRRNKLPKKIREGIRISEEAREKWRQRKESGSIQTTQVAVFQLIVWASQEHQVAISF
jgi:hypothetical protein